MVWRKKKLREKAKSCYFFQICYRLVAEAKFPRFCGKEIEKQAREIKRKRDKDYLREDGFGAALEKQRRGKGGKKSAELPRVSDSARTILGFWRVGGRGGHINVLKELPRG
jgi:hypothetical protein